MDKQLRVFDPTTTPKEQALRYAPRPTSLQGKKVGLVENTKYNSDTLLLKIGKILQDEYGVQGMLMRRKRSSGVPAHEEIIRDILAECDVVIAGVEIEARAARAVCSTALCLKNVACQPLPSSPMCSRPPVGPWQRPGVCQIISIWRCLTRSLTLLRSSLISVPAKVCRRSLTSCLVSTCLTSKYFPQGGQRASSTDAAAPCSRYGSGNGCWLAEVPDEDTHLRDMRAVGQVSLGVRLMTLISRADQYTCRCSGHSLSIY